MSCARHLGGNGCQRLAPEIGIIAILGDVALELGSEAVVALADRHLGCHPECTPQPRIAELRQLRLPPELPRLMGGQVNAPRRSTIGTCDYCRIRRLCREQQVKRAPLDLVLMCLLR